MGTISSEVVMSYQTDRQTDMVLSIVGYILWKLYIVLFMGVILPRSRCLGNLPYVLGHMKCITVAGSLTRVCVPRPLLIEIYDCGDVCGVYEDADVVYDFRNVWCCILVVVSGYMIRSWYGCLDVLRDNLLVPSISLIGDNFLIHVQVDTSHNRGQTVLSARWLSGGVIRMWEVVCSTDEVCMVVSICAGPIPRLVLVSDLRSPRLWMLSLPSNLDWVIGGFELLVEDCGSPMPCVNPKWVSEVSSSLGKLSSRYHIFSRLSEVFILVGLVCRSSISPRLFYGNYNSGNYPSNIIVCRSSS